MKSNLLKITVFALLPAGWLVFAGCAAAPQVNKTVTMDCKEGVPGGTMVESYQTAAKVIAINAATRQITFRAPDGSTNTFRAGPKFTQFESYRVGEAVKVTVARELSMFPANAIPPVAADPAAIVRATPGVQPGVLTADPQQFTATVAAVDLARREATLCLSDGRMGTFKIRQDIDLAQVKFGEKVVIRTSAAMAVLLEKP